MAVHKAELGSALGTGYAGGRSPWSCPVKRILLVFFALCMALPALAEASEADEAAPKVIYYALVPALVGNYGSDGKLRYYKADIALRVSDSQAEEKVKHHEPLIRNQLVPGGPQAGAGGTYAGGRQAPGRGPSVQQPDHPVSRGARDLSAWPEWRATRCR